MTSRGAFKLDFHISMTAQNRALLTGHRFREALESVLGAQDEVFAVFSGIYTFAHRFGLPVHEAADLLIQIMLDVAGKTRTLVLPAFSFSLPTTGMFDVVRTPSDIGLLPNRALLHPALRRSTKPMNSYLVAGPRAEELLSLRCTTSWGPDGVMAWLNDVGARTCILGVPWSEACSLYHLAEEMERVPYRYFKRFSGELFRDGKREGTCEEVMFARSMIVPPIWAHDRIDRALEHEGVVVESAAAEFSLSAASTPDIIRVTRRMLKNDPYAYVANPEAVRSWSETGLADEEQSLPPDSRVLPQDILPYL